MTHASKQPGGEAPRPVYEVGDRVLGIHDLLERFADPMFLKDGIPRLSDLHLKVGEPACYRFDGDLEPLPGAAPLTREVLEALLFPLLREDQIARLCEDVLEAGREHPGTFVFVTNETGMGIVPDNALSRLFRDLSGRANQVMAAACEEVFLLVCGQPLRIKPSSR